MKREPSEDWPARRSLIIKVAVSAGVSILAIVAYVVAPVSISTGVSRGETEVTPSPSAPSQAAQSDSPELQESKAELNAVIKEFVPRYFNRDASLTVTQHRERLQGFVTETFLENQALGLTTEQDQDLVQEDAKIEAVSDVETPMGHFSTDGNTAEVQVIMTVTKFAADGTEVSSGDFYQRMTLVKTESGWRVESLF